jgi:hypothetical protein
MLRIATPKLHYDHLDLNSPRYLTGAVICGRYWDRTSYMLNLHIDIVKIPTRLEFCMIVQGFSIF